MIRVLTFALLCYWSVSAASPELQAEVSALESQGRFLQASNTLFRAIELTEDEFERRELRFKIDRLERIRKDFPLSKEALFLKLQAAVKGLSVSEFERWLSRGWFSVRTIDGEKEYMVSSVSNLFFRHPELNRRRMPQKDTAELERATLVSCRQIAQAARNQASPFVLPKRFRVQMMVEAAAESCPSGELKAWLPIPREYPHQTGFQLVETIGRMQHLAPPESPIRSILVGTQRTNGKPSRLGVVYEYTAFGVRHALNPAAVSKLDNSRSDLTSFTNTAPHVQFTKSMRQLAQRIAGKETNPCLQARRFYDWISENIQYSYAVEYSTVPNLGEYCLENRYGDCGQTAFLFITLCRLSGIPARWQSGWSTFPGAKTIHDWAEIYLHPYGWVPVDPYMGVFATQYASSLTTAEGEEIKDFYFGGLDQYRMAANSDHCQTLLPEKTSFRADTVDFQRGELECNGSSLYFDEFDYDLSIQEISIPNNQ